MSGSLVGDHDLNIARDGTDAKLDDETADQVRRVVASYSADADECAMFLAMLGVGTGTGCERCGGEMRKPKGGLASRRAGADGICYTCRTNTKNRRPLRECGHIDDGTDECEKCSTIVAADEVRAVVKRIQDRTDIKPTQLAQLAGIHPVARLTGIIYKNSEQKTAKRDILNAVIDLDMKIAMGEVVPRSPEQLADDIAHHIDKLVAAGWGASAISRHAGVGLTFVGRFTEPAAKRPCRVNPDSAQRVLAIPIGPPIRDSPAST